MVFKPLEMFLHQYVFTPMLITDYVVNNIFIPSIIITITKVTLIIFPNIFRVGLIFFCRVSLTFARGHGDNNSQIWSQNPCCSTSISSGISLGSKSLTWKLSKIPGFK